MMQTHLMGNGIIVFISNNSFLNAKTDDGIRKALYDEFDYIYTINLKGNTRSSNWRKEGGKIFGQGARVGIIKTRLSCIIWWISNYNMNF